LERQAECAQKLCRACRNKNGHDRCVRCQIKYSRARRA
jgi:hypothetical protein